MKASVNELPIWTVRKELRARAIGSAARRGEPETCKYNKVRILRRKFDHGLGWGFRLVLLDGCS